MATTPTISNFKGALAHGGARPSLFEMSVSKPTAVSGNFDNMATHCNVSAIPPLTVTPIERQYFGRTAKIPGDIVFGDLSTTIINSEDYSIKKVIEDWMDNINSTSSNKGFILGFNVRAIPQARDIAKRDGVDIKYYSIIYELISDMKKLMGGLLKPDIKEKITGNVEIREIFPNSKLGNIAGCYVKNGLIKRTSKIRILRDNVVVHDGTIRSLKRFKDEAKEVQHGYECGVTIEDFNDIKISDIIETYELIEHERTL